MTNDWFLEGPSFPVVFLNEVISYSKASKFAYFEEHKIGY